MLVIYGPIKKQNKKKYRDIKVLKNLWVCIKCTMTFSLKNKLIRKKDKPRKMELTSKVGYSEIPLLQS